MFALDALGVAVFQLPVVKLSEGRSRMRGMALMGTLWAATMLGVWAAGAWAHATAAFGILAGAVLVFAVGECLHGAIHTPLSVDLAPPQLVGRYTAAASISWQIGWIIGPAAGGFLLQHRPLLLWPIAAAVNLACAAAALALEPQLPGGFAVTPQGEAGFVADSGERVAFPGHARDRRPPQYRCPACRASVRAARAPGTSGRGTAPRLR